MTSISPSEIGWAHYDGYEGPFFRGRQPYTLPSNPSSAHLVMDVITATEGGHYDSFNGYDSCDTSLGLIQWCDRGQFSVCDMLGALAQENRAFLEPVTERCQELGIAFKRNHRGRWRFFFPDNRGEVDRDVEQDQLYHLHSSGRIGTWDEESRAYAKRWAAAMASVYQDAAAQRSQVAFTVERLHWFVQKRVKPIFDQAPDTGLGQAFRAAYLSFAANNPSWAAKYLQRTALSTRAPMYGHDWLVEVLRELTFAPGIAIYPQRYNAIRPVLERHFGVDLPDMANELQAFEAEHGAAVTVKALQQILLEAGYDLGPQRDDDVLGPKTRAALRSFQQTHGLSVTGYPDGPTRDALFALRDALVELDGDSLDERTRRRVKALVGTTIADMARRAVRDIERARSGA